MALVTREFDYEQAHKYVADTPNVRWDGWDIVTRVPDHKDKAVFMNKGVFDRTTRRWYIEHRVSPDTNGKWSVKVREYSRPVGR